MNLAGVQSSPGLLADTLMSHGLARFFNRIIEFGCPHQHFLIGQAVQRARKSAHTSSKGQVWVRERGPHKVRGMRTDVTSFVIGMDNEVDAHQRIEGFLVVTQHSGKVGRVVELIIPGSHLDKKLFGVIRVIRIFCHLAVVKSAAVDQGSQGGQLRHQVHAIFVTGLVI